MISDSTSKNLSVDLDSLRNSKNKNIFYSNKILNFIFLISTFLILLFDQITKYIINLKPQNYFPLALIPNFLYITRVTNTGASFGMFQNKTNILIIVSVIAIILIIVLKIKLNLKSFFYNIALGFILGGAIGNLIDRFLYGEVTDFIHVVYFAVFNIADSFIVIGFGIIIIILIKSYKNKNFFLKNN